MEDKCSYVRSFSSYSAASNARSIAWILPSNLIGNSTGPMSAVYWVCAAISNVFETIAHILGCGTACAACQAKINSCFRYICSLCSMDTISSLCTSMCPVFPTGGASNTGSNVSPAGTLSPMPVTTGTPTPTGQPNYGSGKIGGGSSSLRYGGTGSGYHPLVNGPRGSDDV